jgi:hypothetical protein
LQVLCFFFSALWAISSSRGSQVVVDIAVEFVVCIVRRRYLISGSTSRRSSALACRHRSLVRRRGMWFKNTPKKSYYVDNSRWVGLGILKIENQISKMQKVYLDNQTVGYKDLMNGVFWA